MNDVIDKQYATLKLIEALFYKGMVNKATFDNVKSRYPEVFQADKPDGFLEILEKTKMADAM